MKAIKIFLVTVCLLLVAAILFGIYVWYSFQKLSSETAGYREIMEQNKSQNGVTIKEITEVSDDEIQSSGEEVIEIKTSELTESQQKALQSFGIEGDTLTITDAMISCAKDAVGTTRYEEILAGAAPTPLESLKLLPCMNK